jgi:hypothetical protein
LCCSRVALPSGIVIAGLRHPSTSHVLGVCASWSALTLVRFGHRLLGPACPLGCFGFAQMGEHWRPCLGRGRGGLGWASWAAHAATKCPPRAGARAETLRGQAQGATGAMVAPPPARGAPCAAPELRIGTPAQPGGQRLVWGPLMPMEADRCEDARDGGGRGGVGSDQGSQRAQDARAFLSAGRALLVRQGLQRERGGERAAMFRPVSPRQRLGHRVCPGWQTRVAGRGEGPWSACSSPHGAEQAPARYPSPLTNDVRQVERHGIE